MLADEVLTPDSSRFWPADQWEPGATPPSFDKQPVRDYLDALDWDKKPPPRRSRPRCITATRARYVEAYERITGLSFADWPRARPAPQAASAVGCHRRAAPTAPGSVGAAYHHSWGSSEGWR